MAISETQLSTWAHLPSSKQFTDTYDSIKHVLNHKDAPFVSRSYDIHLQGSYGNDTNVYGDSDVDVVICTSDTFGYDLQHLTLEQKAQCQRLIGQNVESAFCPFKQQVISWLVSCYGTSAVLPGNKAIFLKGNGSRRDADILVCTEHRQYHSTSLGEFQFYPGVRFYTPSGVAIENFPKEHSEDCTTKHQNTGSRFKPTIRIFKNMRNRMIDKGIIQDGLAPSYYIEGMLWNVPNDQFVGTHVGTVANCLSWLAKADRDKLLCAHQLRYLLRDGRPDSWSPANFDQFLKATVKFWHSGV
jgi:hypothetical protein